MKHVADAKNLIERGRGTEALEIIENLLNLAPQNHAALQIKAQILDAQGRFDESLSVLRKLSGYSNLAPDVLLDLEKRSLEEREVSVYSDLTPEGRWYFAFPGVQVWISVYGFFGCAAFLLLSPGLIGQTGTENLLELAFAFFLFVGLPWLALMVVHFAGVKKILVGLEGLRVCKRMSHEEFSWSQIGSAVLEYDNDIKSGHLFLALYEKESRKLLTRLNVSRKKSVVRARRHFVRTVLSHVDVVSHVCRDRSASFPAEPAEESSPARADHSSERSI